MPIPRTRERLALALCFGCLSLLPALTGCGTIFGGTTELVSIQTTPPGVSVTTVPVTGTLTTPASVALERKNSYTLTFMAEGYESSELGAALLRRRPKGLLPAARQELLDPSKAWWGGRRGRLADRPRYSISVSLGVVPRWYSRVVEVPVRIEVAAGFVAPGASEPPRLQPSWPPGGSRPAHG